MKRRSELQNVKPTKLILTFIVFSLFSKHEIRNSRIEGFFVRVFYCLLSNSCWTRLSLIWRIICIVPHIKSSHILAMYVVISWSLLWAWFLFFDMMRITLELVQCMIEPNSDGNPLLAAATTNHKSSWLGNLGDLYKRPQRNWHADWKTVNFAVYKQNWVCYFLCFLTQYLRTIFLNNSLSLCKRLRIKFPLQKCPWRIQLFRERLSAKMCTRQSRKVIWDMINTLFLTL